MMKNKFKVRSRSHPGEFHIVDILPDGKIVCDCEAGLYNRPCWHKELIKNYLKKHGEQKNQKTTNQTNKIKQGRNDAENSENLS